MNCTALQRQEPVAGKLELDEAIAVARVPAVVDALGIKRTRITHSKIYERHTVPRSLGNLAVTTKKVGLAVVVHVELLGHFSAGSFANFAGLHRA